MASRDVVLATFTRKCGHPGTIETDRLSARFLSAERLASWVADLSKNSVCNDCYRKNGRA